MPRSSKSHASATGVAKSAKGQARATANQSNRANRPVVKAAKKRSAARAKKTIY